MLGSEVAKVTCQKWRALIKFLCSLRYNKTDIDIQTHRQTEIYRYLCVHIYIYTHVCVCMCIYTILLCFIALRLLIYKYILSGKFWVISTKAVWDACW